MFKKPNPVKKKPLQPRQNPIPGSAMTPKQQQQQQQQQQREQEKKNRDEDKLVRDVSILSNLLTYNFNDIPKPTIQAELAALLVMYPNSLNFLIIDIIDIIHDAHHSRDATSHCYSLPLFKLVVCNIFGITYDLYDYILKNVIPVSQSVLIRLLQNTPGIYVTNAAAYFTNTANAQNSPPAIPRLIRCNIIRDNVGLGRELINHIHTLGFQIVYSQTPCMILDAVSVPNPNYVELNNYIATDAPPRKNVINQLFPGDVAITASGSNVPPNNYNVRFEYNAPANARHQQQAAAAAVAANHAPAAANQRGIPLPTANAIEQYAVTPAATTPNFDTNFPWNPTVNPLVGFKPIIFDDPVARLDLNPNTITASPSNTPKNWAFRLAVAQGAVGGIGIGGQVAADPRNQQAVEQIITANARLYILYDQVARAAAAADPNSIAAGLALPAGFQHLTLQQYILFKLAGDFSYCLYIIAAYLTFVSTSDIISGLRLSLFGINLLFSMVAGMYVFYQNTNIHAILQQPVVAQYIPMVLNLIFRKCKVEKKKVVRRLKEQITINKKIKIQRESPRLAGLVPGPGLHGRGRGQSGGVGNDESFPIMIAKAINNKQFNTELSPLIKPVDNPKISPENLKLLVSVLKTQFDTFKNQLAEFKEEGKFCIASNSTNDYKIYCKEIIEFLGCIINTMSSEEFIAYFEKECTGKSYEECIKSMSSYVLMFPFIFDTETSSWYLNCTYPFSVCLNEYILSLLENKPKDPENLDRINKIIDFVSKLKEIAYIERDITPLEYGKNIPFNNAVSLVIMDKCKKESKESLQKFIGDDKQYKENSNLQLTKFDDTSLREFIKKLSRFIPKDTSDVEVTSEDTGVDTIGRDVTLDDTDNDTVYFKEIDNFFQNFVVDNNILYEDFVKELVSFLIQNNNIIQEGIFSVIKFILLFQNFDNIALCSYTVVKTIIEAFLNREYSSKSFASINNELNMLFYYNNLDNFFNDVPAEVLEKIKETRTKEGLTSIDQLSILEQNISVQVDLYSYCEDYALSKFYDELYDDSIESERTFETTDEYIDFQMEKLQEFINKEVDKYLSYDEITEEYEEEEEQLQLGQQQQQQKQYQQQIGQQQQHVFREGEAVAAVSGGKNNPKSKHKAKYRKKYKKFVSKYIIKKNKKQNKNKNKSIHSTKNNNKNKTKKNKRLAKNKPNSKYAKKTLKNKKCKSKSKSSNNKSKQNKKANTNYYNLYKHKKTLKH
jgi:hypothetical protein